MTRSGYGWLASAATSCVTATWDLAVQVVVGEPAARSWVPTGIQSADTVDNGLRGKITNVKHDFVDITVSGIVYSRQSSSSQQVEYEVHCVTVLTDGGLT